MRHSPFRQAVAPVGVAVAMVAVAAGRLPVTVGYRGRVPSLPGVKITHVGRGTARGYLTLAGAKAFGAALARQFAADHARVTPRPSVIEGLSVQFLRSTQAGTISSAEFGTNFPIFVDPTTHKPTVGALQVYSSAQLVSPAKVTGTPYEYDLAYGDTSGLIPPERHVVRPAGLATVTGRYYSDVAGTGALFRFGLFPAQWDLPFGYFIPPFSVPRVQTEYLTGNPAIRWSDGYSQENRNLAGGQSDDLRTVHAGERTAESWNAYPLHEGYNVNLIGAANLSPWVPSASRAGDRLTLDVTPFSDSTPAATAGSSAARPARWTTSRATTPSKTTGR